MPQIQWNFSGSNNDGHGFFEFVLESAADLG